MDKLLLVNLATSLYMTGVIWFVQVVHYPLFLAVGREGFAAYEARHGQLTSIVVAPAMLLELGVSIWILARGGASGPVWVASGLTALLWVSTFLVQVPLHERLRGGYDAELIARLVWTNWWRTAGWTMRAGLLLWESLKRSGLSLV
jgi:hypothetical protein